jgi:uncharacterized protein YrrD
MDDLGPPASYLTLSEGVRVYSREGESLGEVEHVLADPEVDVFDGFVIDTSVLPGGRRFVDASQVESIHERGVLLNLDQESAQRLPEPSANPAAMEAGPDDLAGEGIDDRLEDKLRRAWDLISGKG